MIVPNDAVPVVHGTPITVRLTAAVTAARPPAPTTLSGTERFETAIEHGPKRHTFAKPSSAIVPPKLPDPPKPEKLDDLAPRTPLVWRAANAILAPVARSIASLDPDSLRAAARRRERPAGYAERFGVAVE